MITRRTFLGMASWALSLGGLLPRSRPLDKGEAAHSPTRLLRVRATTHTLDAAIEITRIGSAERIVWSNGDVEINCPPRYLPDGAAGILCRALPEPRLQ